MRFKGMLILLLLASLFNASAIAGCVLAPTAEYPLSSTLDVKVPLAASHISVPPNTPVGSVIYEQRIHVTTLKVPRLHCDATSSVIQADAYYLTTPYAQTSPGSGIYKTGIDGIGVRIIRVNGGASLPTSFSIESCAPGISCYRLSTWIIGQALQFIKTAENIGSGTIQANALPTERYTLRNGDNSDIFTLYDINFSGSLTLNTPTCDVSPASQSMVVQMGSHKVSAFSGQYTGTAWKNASIVIHNCGWFYGNSPTSIATFDGTSNINVVPLTTNKARVTFSFYETPTDPTEGIMALDSTPYSAVGIGIQLSQGPNVSGKFNLNAPVVNYVIPSNGASSWSLPLYARYVQTTTSAPQPGHANGKLEFIISYQ